MPKHHRRSSQSTPPSGSSRYTDDRRDRKNRYDIPRTREASVRGSRSRASSVSSQEREYDSRDKYYLSASEDEGSPYIQRRPRHPAPTVEDRHSLRSLSCAPPSRSSSPESHYSHGSRRQPPKSTHSPSTAPYPPSSSWNRARYPSPRPRGRRTYTPDQYHHHDEENEQHRSTRHPQRRRRSTSETPHSSSQPKSKSHLALSAASNALEAGAMAALRLRHDPAPWLGAKKGGQIAAAALGAAVVDTFVEQRAPRRKGGLRHAVARQAAVGVIGRLVCP